MKRHRILAQGLAGVVLLTAISACGGGSGEGAPIAVVPGPTPTATASPTPMPTPSPTVPAYPTVNDLTRDLVIDGQLGVTFDTFEAASADSSRFVGATLFPSDTRYTLSFAASPETARFAINGTSDSYTVADRTDVGQQRLYRRSGAPDLLLGPETGRAATYTTQIGSALYTPETRAGVAGRHRLLRLAVAGRPTLAADPPPSSLSFRGTALVLGGLADQAPYTSTDTLDFSVTGNQVLGNVSALGFGGTQVILTFAGTLDRTTNSVQGTITDSRTGFTGLFRGQLFGPSGAELGIVFRAERASDGALLVGDYIGTW